MDDWRADRIGSALRGENPTVLGWMPSSFAVIGDVQWLPGYSLLLVNDPEIERLSDLPRLRRREFLEAMADLGEAVVRACRQLDPAFRRVNLEILGNSDPYLHAHVWPRYEWKPPERIGHPVWLFPVEKRWDSTTAVAPQHDHPPAAIAEHLVRNA